MSDSNTAPEQKADEAPKPNNEQSQPNVHKLSDEELGQVACGQKNHEAAKK